MKYSRKNNQNAPDSLDAKVFDKHNEQRKIVRSYWFYNIGIFLGWSSFVSLFNLQSSINVEDGLGTRTLAVTFILEIICCTFWSPVALRKFGPKLWLVVGDLAMIPYILANLYPSYYTLLPAGILLAILQSSLWPSMCMINVLYATLYSGVSKRAKGVHTILFSGYFFTAFQASQVFGDIVAYVVLYGFDQIPVPTIESFDQCFDDNKTAQQNMTCNSNQTKYRYCGGNDCQDASVISGNIDQYKPVNQISLYVLIAVSLLLAIGATLVHAFLVPNDKTFEKKQKYYDSQMKLLEKGSSNISNSEKEDSEDLSTTEDRPESESIIKLCVETAKSVLNHISTPKFCLLVPITLYNGLAMAFVATEATRSFASCILGVQWVGVCMALYGLSDATLSWVVGRFGRKVGRISLFVVGLVLECGNYAYLLYWAPSPFILLSILGVFFTFGITDGIFQTIINVTHIDFFSKNEDLAVLSWNMLILSGFAIGYVLSPILCVSTRVYLNLAFLIVGFICVAIADRCHRKDNDVTKTQRNNERKQSNDETHVILT